MEEMKMKTGILLGTCTAVSILIVLTLFLLSGELRDKRNSFLRLFPSHPALEADTFNVKYNSYYIAGGTSHHIYLGNYRAPLHLLVVNAALTDSQHVKLNVDNVNDQKFWSLRVKVDSPNFYLVDGAVPRIYRGTVDNWHAKRFSYDSAYFLDIVPLSFNSFVIKSLGYPVKENIIGKLSASDPHLNFTTGILEKQIDGVFCTNGVMTFNRKLNQLIYLYYYRNEYIVMDSTLNVIYRGHTIDTTSKARIKVATIASENAITMSAPPLLVNKRNSVQGNLMFINSNLLARNEHPDAFNDGSVIDVYDLINHKYKFSFYIYHYWPESKLSDFQVFGNKIFVLFDEHLQTYNLREKYFSRQDLER
jgi:hypothetical protein